MDVNGDGRISQDEFLLAAKEVMAAKKEMREGSMAVSVVLKIVTTYLQTQKVRQQARGRGGVGEGEREREIEGGAERGDEGECGRGRLGGGGREGVWWGVEGGEGEATFSTEPQTPNPEPCSNF